MKKKVSKIENVDGNVITINLEDGASVNANILFTFNENDEQFILYEIDNVAYGAKINPDNSLIPIEEDEWVLVERIFNEWQEEQNKEDENNDN